MPVCRQALLHTLCWSGESGSRSRCTTMPLSACEEGSSGSSRLGASAAALTVLGGPELEM